ncbi:glutamate-tRNA ligase [Phytophthora nicotianae INRA-310]|uniref:glutamate--tRNA ligase n=3 Tax=Phytophthora nicotianae TaxID=4792 RepID=W2PM22_PHYN3|nr:glutamate-tRNA ligase [Phytophthora nicotianae INRA-310]ETN01274.1 glutamate-tRNA ligase [Phytophthora nicotianae INRA-310]KUF97919.1 Dynein intermediate chain 2 [Phytophthora nicotianae]
MATEAELTAQIAAAGEKVRDLKAAKDATKADEIKEAVAQLLAFKAQFKEVTGKDFGPPPKPKKEKKPQPEQQKPKDPAKKSKKELNKERKKAHKHALKAGVADESPAAAAAHAAPAAVAAPAAATDGKKALKKAAHAGIELPTPSAEDDGVIVFSSAGQLPRASYVVAQLVKYAPGFRNFGRDAAASAVIPTLTLADGRIVSGDFAIARFLARTKPELGLYGVAAKDAAANEAALPPSQIDAWLDFALTRLGPNLEDDGGLQILNRVLKTQTFIVGHALSLADICVWSLVAPLQKKLDLSPFPNVTRWLAYLEAQQTLFAKVDGSLKALKPIKAPAPTGAAKKKDTGSCPPLKDAVDGQVVTRFPPEPSGYLHIGHIKACMLNNYYARHYHGKLILRFDDTNPSKEKDEFEQSIIADLKRVEVFPDVVTYTSDYFDKIADFARQMIREGNAYMDNTSQERMREERMEGINSKCRDQTPEENLALFEKMLKNAPEAQGYCMRGKIDMQAKNKTMRDPVFFRLNPTPHHRTGTKYQAYPTYDLACPIVDSLEGVTHALRTTEYNDRDFQYQWVLDTLRLRKVIIQGFARMNFVYSVLSKRKLQWFVDNGHVESWRDPRFPTVQGVLRRGVQVEALREFILSQGASRRITDMEWDKFWTLNKRVLDPTAPRYFAVAKESSVPLTLTNVSGEVIGIPVARHPKDPSMGNKMVRFCNKLLLERDDVNNFVEGEEVTLMRHGNIIVKKLNKAADGTITSVEAVNHPEGDFKKTKLKVTWLADVPDLVPLTLVEFDHLLNKPKLEEGDDFQDFLTETTRAEMHAVGDHELRNMKEGQVVQLERRGYFRVDVPYISDDKPVVMFMVPDGKVKAMSTLSTKLAHR